MSNRKDTPEDLVKQAFALGVQAQRGATGDKVIAELESRVIKKIAPLIHSYANEARVDELKRVSDNAPHIGGDDCMSCHLEDDYLQERIAELEQESKS